MAALKNSQTEKTFSLPLLASPRPVTATPNWPPNVRAVLPE